MKLSKRTEHEIRNQMDQLGVDEYLKVTKRPYRVVTIDHAKVMIKRLREKGQPVNGY